MSGNCKVAVVGGVKTSYPFRKAVNLLPKKDGACTPEPVVSDSLKRTIIQVGERPISRRSESLGLKTMSR